MQNGLELQAADQIRFWVDLRNVALGSCRYSEKEVPHELERAVREGQGEASFLAVELNCFLKPWIRWKGDLCADSRKVAEEPAVSLSVSQRCDERNAELAAAGERERCECPHDHAEDASRPLEASAAAHIEKLVEPCAQMKEEAE